jgi:hypothetical protein
MNPASLIDTLKYLDAEAAAGHFKGRSGALSVLRYLATNSWHRYPNPEGQPPGTVLYGKSAYKIIARDTAIAYSSVKIHVGWLEDNQWLALGEQEHDARGYAMQHRIRLRLDPTGHEYREDHRKMWADLAADSSSRKSQNIAPGRG